MIATPRQRIARSYLFAPGSSEKLVEKVFRTGADAVVLDLEDSVASSEKERARALVQRVVETRGVGDPPTFVRPNRLDGGLWRKDVEAVVGEGLTGLRLPKVVSPEEVERVAGALNELEERRGLAPGHTRLMCTVETTAGLLRAGELVREPRVDGLVFGSVDFLRDLRGQPSDDESETLYARSHVTIVSRAAGLMGPVLGVYPYLKDDDGLRRTSLEARRFGFSGRSCLHPRQVPIVNQVFAPTAPEIASAREVVDAFEEAASSGRAALALPDGRFVDVAVYEHAQEVLRLAEELEACDMNKKR